MRVRAASLLAAAVAALALSLVLAPGARAAAPPPEISAPSAILVEASTGDVLYERAADRRRAIASTTKLMTALLTMEKARLSEMVPASDYVAAPIESKLSLRPGEELSVADLMRGLMLESANDAAVTLAEHISGSRAAFVRLMNRRARELKLRDTHFENPIGLDAPGNFSSARDLARLALVLRRHSFVRKIADRASATLTTGDRPRTIRNRNTLLARDRRVNGLKTGRTVDAGYVLVGSRRYERITLVSVVLGTQSMATRDADSLALLRWGQDLYHVVVPVSRSTVVAEPEIEYRRGATVPLITSGTVRRAVRADAEITTRDVGVPDMVTGPVGRGQRFGHREVLADGERIAAVPIVAQYYVPAADFPQRAKDSFTRLPALILAVAVLGGTVLLARRLRRGPRRRPPRSEPEAA
jgi:serine-type D-Ala-D-Ala carboxypeptidase (penicillin-binding protein 5/6)